MMLYITLNLIKYLKQINFIHFTCQSDKKSHLIKKLVKLDADLCNAK